MQERLGRRSNSGASFAVPLKKFVLPAIAAMVVGGMVSGASLSQPAEKDGKKNGVFTSVDATVKHVVVTVNKSRTFNLDAPFTRILPASDIVDVLPLSDRSIYIQGKKVGTTNVSLIDANAHLIGVLDVVVAPDTGSLQENIRSGGGSQGIRVSSSQGQIVLSGVAADAVAADRAMRVAKSAAGEGGEVVNAMTVAPSQQVMLEVRFLEVTRDAGRQLGVSLMGANTSNTQGIRTGRGSVLNPNAVSPSAPTTPSGIPIFATAGSLVGGGIGTPFGTFVSRLLSTNDFRVDAVITALEDKGLVRRLAEPNLIALSGEPAKFVAGGEFPVPIASTSQGGVPTITIAFKEFGVKLNFTPTVLSRGVINLRVEPEVSELDFTNAVQLQGTLIPALTKRSAHTMLELRDGQSFALAGLLSSQHTRNVAQVPWIGSVPVIGALFRSAAYQQQETDLVIIVTPRLVAPVTPGQRLASPLDSRLPSNDVDFFLNGAPELRKRYQDYIAAGGELTGPYGHMIAPELGPTKPANKR
jgi:pilus assembly protein CpaC